jgi:hypothetical protein
MNAATIPPVTDPERRQTQVARRITAALDQLSVPHDIEQRLRVSRELAVTRARAVRNLSAQRHRAGGVAMVGAGQAALGGGGSDRAPWWVSPALLTLVLLVVGLMAIDVRNEQVQIEAAAEVDAALLADDLPPDAYSDAGFREFLHRPLAVEAAAD